MRGNGSSAISGPHVLRNFARPTSISLGDHPARLLALFRSYAGTIELNQDSVDRLCDQFRRDLGEHFAEYGTRPSTEPSTNCRTGRGRQSTCIDGD
jgi:hypothetical protein